MISLAELQNQFQNYLMHDHPEFKKMVVSTEKVSAKTRLAIYSNAYRERLIEALASNYPILEKYVGEDQFRALGLKYLEQHPSTQPSIRWFGDKLSSHLAEYPSLAELAQFEWTQTLVFDAADHDILEMSAVAAVSPDSWETMRFTLHPSVHRLNLSWNTVQLWQNMADDLAPIEPLQSHSPIPWIVWRRELMNRFHSLNNEEAEALDAIMNGATFGEICEKSYEWVGEEKAGPHAASLLKGWIVSGLITNLYY